MWGTCPPPEPALYRGRKSQGGSQVGAKTRLYFHKKENTSYHEQGTDEYTNTRLHGYAAGASGGRAAPPGGGGGAKTWAATAWAKAAATGGAMGGGGRSEGGGGRGGKSRGVQRCVSATWAARPRRAAKTSAMRTKGARRGAHQPAWSSSDRGTWPPVRRASRRMKVCAPGLSAPVVLTTMTSSSSEMPGSDGRVP